jgi:LuxR family quorum-sensing system transcriptional regulator CciR
LSRGTAERPCAGLTNYPLSWREELIRGLADDPVLRAAERRSAGFAWDELPAIIRLTRAERLRMESAAQHGLVNGYTVPAHVPGEGIGSSSFPVRGERALPRHSLVAAQALGAFAFEAVRRLARRDRESAVSSVPPLTRRQRECLALVARGKSDGVIGEILGIRPHTVTEHIEAARRRYAVATRAQLIVRALIAGDLSYGEID